MNGNDMLIKSSSVIFDMSVKKLPMNLLIEKTC